MTIIETTVTAKPDASIPGIPYVFMEFVRWMEENVGNMYVDWEFDVTNISSKYLKVKIKDREKATMTALRWS
jgi:hypothetical protein